MKDQYEFHGDGVRPVNATNTQWIDHKFRVIGWLVDKFGLYCQHIQHAIPEIKNSNDRATLRGKFEKLIDAKVLLCSRFFSDILSADKTFNLTNQKSDTYIIAIVENVELTKRGYEINQNVQGQPHRNIHQSTNT